jgi:SAM-dependent methyltransferase
MCDLTEGRPMPPGIDTSKPHSARMYDYFLNGKDNYAADRETAEKAIASWPAVRTAVRENRTFLGRAVRYLVAQEGIRQFLDVGTGLPSANNVHEVAQAAAPESRVVYVDNDPIVLLHAQVLLASTPQGRTAYIQADLREPGKILASPEVGQTLDLTKPVALMLVAILHFITDDNNPGQIVSSLMDALPPGSFLVASHVTPEHDPEGVGGLEAAYQAGGVPTRSRTAAEFREMAFRGLEMIDPGVVLVSEWRRPGDSGPAPAPAEVSWYGGIGRKRA